MDMTITSSAFAHNGSIPTLYRDIFAVSIFQRIKYVFWIFGDDISVPAAEGARRRWFFVGGARVFPVFAILGRPPSPLENRGRVCRVGGSRVVALTAGVSWSLDQ